MDDANKIADILEPDVIDMARGLPGKRCCRIWCARFLDLIDEYTNTENSLVCRIPVHSQKLIFGCVNN